ncbi:MAG: hypothetical protein JSS72_07890 [Armatimonadetes bacterium]|nr:hypothetical protein [Armatimonadota bacterium]
MKSVEEARHEQRSATFIGLLLFNLMLVLIQIWLCFGVVENLVDGKPAMAVPAAIGSLVCFGVNVWMYFGVVRLEKERL